MAGPFKLRSQGSSFKQMGSSPLKVDPTPSDTTTVHNMYGSLNEDGTKVVNKKGDWVGSGDNPDAVAYGKKKTEEEKIATARRLGEEARKRKLEENK